MTAYIIVTGFLSAFGVVRYSSRMPERLADAAKTIACTAICLWAAWLLFAGVMR